MSANKRNVRVGIFIFVGLTLFTIGVLAIGNINNTFTRTIYISTVFDDVSGLQPGNNIWFSGVKVGTVKKINFYGTSQVQVTMGIEEKSIEYIRKDAKAKISSDGFIGNKIIVITGGSAAYQPVQEGDVLAVETTISTESMINTLQKNNVNLLSITEDFKLISKNLAAGEGTLGKLLKDDDLYTRIETTLATLQTTANNAKQLTASVAEFTNKLNDEGNFANDLVTDTIIFHDMHAATAQLETITKNAEAMTANLKSITSDLQTETNSPAGVILNDTQSAEEIKSILKNLEEGSRKLNENMEALQHNFLLKGYFKKKDKEENK